MTRKIYRTAQGKMVDLGALQLQNENIRAVGNMGVNARGDLIDSGNRPIDTRGKQVTKQYNRQTVSTVPASSQKQQARQQVKQQIDVPAAPEDFEDDFVKETSPELTVSSGSGGLAAAIAKARQIKQEPITPPSKTTEGIKKF